ncbi:glycosyltransferase family 87 protein [Ralstonia soli]|uniref:DUF2029 domain-containing protein n=1 Tax=Ralstonia soli TaxID=2953896 RepID=A0ABT1AJU2_9RALS|nr:glycosyltransferase family 87 protein [Ralstonia soli]MCO5398529.1 DUF2029 domain-containing protein [Ralstonia soli]
MNQKSMRLPVERNLLARSNTPPDWITLDRVRVYSAAMLVLFAVFLVTWGWVTKGFTDTSVSRPGTDFGVFWGASYLALGQGSMRVYDLHQLSAVVAEHGTLQGGSTLILPWLYPPTFLLMVLPFSLVPLAFSYVLFLLITSYVYLRSVAALTGAGTILRHGLWLPVLASPATIITVLMGQNSLLTAGTAAFAVYWLDRRPVLAGLFIGLLAIKPQFALLFPLVLIVSRSWSAFVSAALTTSVFTGVSVAVCGWETLPAFLDGMRWVQENYVENSGAGQITWYGMSTLFSAARLLSVSVAGAYLVQAIVALVGIGALIHVWRRTAQPGLRAASLVIATMLVTPYLRPYELTWLGIAIAGVVGDGVQHGLSKGEKVLLVLAWLLPLFEYANPFLKLPQLGPLVLIAMLLLILRRVASRG